MIANLEAKIQELVLPFNTHKDELTTIVSQFEQFMKIATSVNETLTRAVEKMARDRPLSRVKGPRRTGS